MSFRSTRRDLRLIIAAKAVSWLGDEMAMVALMLRAQSAGHGASAVAALLIANALPIVALSGLAGRVVDRYDSRVLLVSSSVAQGALCAVLAQVHATGAVLALVALLGAGQAVNAATWQALIATVAPGDELPAAMARSQGARTLAGIAAPALSGLLVGLYSARVPLLADAAAYLAVTGAALLIATRRHVGRAAPGTKPRGGIAIVRHDVLLRTVLSLLGLFVLLGSMVNVVDVFLIRETLHASTTWYGITGAAYSVGALLGALLSGRLRSAPQLATWFIGSCVVLASMLAASGLVPSVAWLLPVLIVLGAANGVLNVAVGALVMGRARPEERGRIGALIGGVASGTQIAAFAASGALAAVLSPREIFVAGGLLGLLAPVAFGRRLVRAAGAGEEAEAGAEAPVETPLEKPVKTPLVVAAG